MQTMINKKGLAEVVTAVVLVSIAAAAAVIVAGYMNTFLFAGEVQFSSGISCIEMQTLPVVEIKSACYNSETGDVEVKVERKLSSIEINDLEFTINSADASKSYACGNACGICKLLGLGESRIYYFETKNTAEQVVLRVGNCVLDEMKINGEC